MVKVYGDHDPRKNDLIKIKHKMKVQDMDDKKKMITINDD